MVVGLQRGQGDRTAAPTSSNRGSNRVRPRSSHAAVAVLVFDDDGRVEGRADLGAWTRGVAILGDDLYIG